MLGEVIAATLGVEMGPYLHDAASMHVYSHNKSDFDLTVKVTEGGAGESLVMPPMPTPDGDQSAIEQVLSLARLEAQMRHAYTEAAFTRVRDEAGQSLNEYWLALFNVLAAWGAAARGWPETARQLCDLLPDYFAANVSVKIASTLATKANTVEAGQEAADGTLFDLAADVPSLAPNPTAMAVADERWKANSDAAWAALVEHLEQDSSLFTVQEIPELRDIMLSEGLRTSARSAKRSEGDASDALKFTSGDIGNAVSVLRAR